MDKYGVIIKAYQDEKYRALLFDAPEKALDGVKLEPKDREILTSLDARSFDAAMSRLDADLRKKMDSGELTPSRAINAGVFDVVEG